MTAPTPHTRLTLVRHGETVWNREGRMQGHGDSELSETGRLQVEALALRLEKIPFDHLYSSDLGRARSSAEAIARRTGHSIRCLSELRERHMGLFEGLTVPEIRQRHPREYQEWVAHDPTRATPGGESLESSTARMLAACNTLVANHAGDHIVAVSHGGVLAGFLRHILGVPPDMARHFKIPNASLNVFLHDERGWWLQTWGDVAHLD